ncbi:MAG TPA: DUF4157 domain-containing protein [Kofleriaceae bacterium]|nr:DUF4157 domain-containing protein [Kofleriaceae bacterium]
MDRLRRGDSVTEDRDRRIEQRAILLVRSGRDWLTAVVEATREIDGDLRPMRSAPGRGNRAGKATRTAGFDAIPGGPLARQRLSGDRTAGDEAPAADGDRGPTLSQSLRAQLVALLGFDPGGRDVEFAPGTTTESDEPVRGADKVKRPKTLAETLALLDDPEVPTDFARQAAVAHALLSADAGESLDAGLQTEFGDRLDVALEDVRVHRDPVSSMIVEALGTRAFAFGRHLFFAPGTYAPTTDAGRSLIAHELAHVAQQPGGDVRDARQASSVRLGREGDAFEENADGAAGALLAGLRPQVQRGAPVAARFDGGGTVNPDGVLRKHIGSDETKAKDALRNSGAKRGMVETIIRDQFSKEVAEEIIKGAPKGGAAAEKAPAVEAKGGGGKAGGKADGGAGKGAQTKSPGQLKGGGGGNAQGSKGGGQVGQLVDAYTGGELSDADRSLISTELAEHQAWSTASAAVGAPGSMDRALFVAGQVGRGFGQGFVTGAVMGVAMGVVGQLAQRFCPVPGVGAIIAGGMAAYGLATRDWGQTRETISNFGEGASKWEKIANSLAAISEILDIVVQVMNVVAGIIGLVSAIMWLVTIITVGIASPLAGTLSAIALGILTVSGVIDNINNLIIQPAIIAFRAMHVMQSDADPREIVGQGAKLADSASKVGSAVGGYLAGRAVDAAGKGIDRRRYGPGGKAGARPAGSGKPTATAKAGNTPDPHASAKPAAGGTPDPHATAKPAAGGTPDPNAAKTGMNSGQVKANAQKTTIAKEFANHRERYAERARAEQAKIAQAEDDAYAARKQQIDDERAAAKQAADKAHDEAVASGKKTAAEAAEARAKIDEAQVQKDYETSREQSVKRNADEARRTEERYNTAKQDADAEHARSSKRISEERAAEDARYQKAMDDAAQIKDPEDRARAERWAKDSYESSKKFADMRQRHADENKASSTARAERDYVQAKIDDAKSVTRREELDLQFKQSAEQRARAARERAQRQTEYEARSKAENAKNRDYNDSYDKRNERMENEPDQAARDARRSTEGDPERMRDGLNLRKTLKDQGDMLKDYRGQKALDWGDVSSKELDPGFSPGGGPVRGLVEEQTKKAFGLDKSTEAERNATEAAQKREYGGDGITDPWTSAPGRIWDEAITGSKKSETQLAAQKADDAQYLPDHAKNANGERKNPHYTPPPAGSLKDLDTIKENWTKAIERQQDAEAAARAMEAEKAKHQANEAPIQGLHGEAKKAIENTAAHKGDVKTKHDANVKQTAKQAEAEQKINDYASQQSKFDAVISPMRGLERFTYIGARLGVGYFDDMNKEVKKTLGGLEDASASMKKEQASQPAAKAELKAKADMIAQTDAKAAATDGSFKTSEKGVATLKQDNTDAMSKAGAAQAEATGQKNVYAQKVTQYQQQYTTMASGLLSWARQHQSERAGEPAHVEVQDGGPEHHEDADAGGGGGGADAGAPAPDAGAPAAAPAPSGAGPVDAGAGASGGAPAGPPAPDAGAPAAPPPAAAAPADAGPPPAAPPAPPPPSAPAKQP